MILFYKKVFRRFVAAVMIPAALFATVAAPRFALGFAVQNPLRGIDSIPAFIARVLSIVLMIIVPLLAIFIAYAGFLFVTAQGNEAQVTKAKNVFLWTVIGAAVALGAQIFASAIQGTIDSLR